MLWLRFNLTTTCWLFKQCNLFLNFELLFSFLNLCLTNFYPFYQIFRILLFTIFHYTNDIWNIFQVFKTFGFKTRTNEDIFPRKDLPLKSFVSEHTQKKKYLEEMTTQKSKKTLIKTYDRYIPFSFRTVKRNHCDSSDFSRNL